MKSLLRNHSCIVSSAYFENLCPPFHKLHIKDEKERIDYRVLGVFGRPPNHKWFESQFWMNGLLSVLFA